MNNIQWNGRRYWIGAVDRLDGHILEMHTHEKAKNSDFHHNMYFSERTLRRENESPEEIGYFTFDRGELIGWPDWDISSLKEKIMAQISIEEERCQ